MMTALRLPPHTVQLCIHCRPNPFEFYGDTRRCR